MKNKITTWFVISLIMVLAGSYMGMRYHTGKGSVEIKEIFITPVDGGTLRGLLYIPKSVSAENPAPAVIGAHGYNNTAELQGLNAIELSRRGFVVLTLDEYGHGKSTFPDERINDGIVSDNGVYAMMQHLKTIPYVNTEKIGLVGHSMGSSSIQLAAARAWQNRETDSSVIVPTAVLPTAQSFIVSSNNVPLLDKYPVNIGAVYGQFDEWVSGMWGVDQGSKVNTTPRAQAVFGFDNPDYGKIYAYGNDTPLSKEDAVAVSANGNLRVLYQPKVVHPRIHMSSEAGKNIIEFFDITLMDGNSPLPYTDQIWHMKELFTGIALIGFFIFSVTLGLMLLKTGYFSTIVRPEPISPSNPKTGSQFGFYWLIYILCLLPAPILWNLTNGYPIGIKSMGRTVPTLFPANEMFPMPTANGLVLFNLATGAIMITVFIAVYKLYMKKNGITIENLGVKIPGKDILKAFLLALTVFAISYVLLAAMELFFNVDFRWYVLSIKTLTAPKFKMFLVYLPFWVFAFVISSLTLNSFTRMQNSKEWKNIILMIFASVGGLLVFWALDYGMLLTTGVKWITTVPYPAGTTSALAGVLLWGLLFILPVSAVISRIFFKATGSIWAGGFINALIITMFAISNTVIAAGVL